MLPWSDDCKTTTSAPVKGQPRGGEEGRAASELELELSSSFACPPQGMSDERHSDEGVQDRSWQYAYTRQMALL